MSEPALTPERRKESRRNNSSRLGGRRAIDIRKNHEEKGSQSQQVLWTCLVAVSLAIASIYKVSHPLTDSRFVRDRSPASENTLKADLISRPGSGYSQDLNAESKVARSKNR